MHISVECHGGRDIKRIKDVADRPIVNSIVDLCHDTDQYDLADPD